MEKNGAILGAIIAILGISMYGFLYWVLPAYYPAWYWLIPAFFFLNACLLSFIIARSEARGERFSVKKYMIPKMFKTFGSLMIVVLCFIFTRVNAISFTLVLALFYLLYTLQETRILLQLNKEDAKNAQKKK